MNGLQDWREWRESVDRVLLDIIRRAEALERRTEPEELIKVVMETPLNTVSVTEQPVNVINFADIDPVPQMYDARYEPTGDAPTIVESSP